MKFSNRSFFIWLAASLGIATAAYAHDAGLSVANLQVKPGALELSVSYAVADVRKMLPPYSLPADAEASPEGVAAAMVYLQPLAQHVWELRAGDTVLSPRDVRAEFIPGDNISFHAVYDHASGAAIAGRALKLSSLLAIHREVFTCVDGQGVVLAEAVLTRENPGVQVRFDRPVKQDDGGKSPTAAAQAPARFGAFFKLGVEHIWTGYDHLLFLFALLVACRSFKAIVIIISCFTLAHSLTLGAATLGLVSLPPSLVEPLIAASIVFVGVENLFLRGKEPKHRGWLTFGFGLIHGFGFASVLRDLGVGTNGSGIGVPLFSFNLGVEAGQICVAAVVLPILLAVFRTEQARLRGSVVMSSLVALAGLYWLAERTLFN